VEISSFSRMKSYRKDGRTAALLKLVLPRAKDGEHGEFTSFYLSVADAYANAVEKLCKKNSDAAPPIVISVNYEAVRSGADASGEGESAITLKRIQRIRCGERSALKTFVDVYDTRRGVFLK